MKEVKIVIVCLIGITLLCIFGIRNEIVYRHRVQSNKSWYDHFLISFKKYKEYELKVRYSVEELKEINRLLDQYHILHEKQYGYILMVVFFISCWTYESLYSKYEEELTKIDKEIERVLCYVPKL